MLTEPLNTNQQKLLFDKLVTAFLTVADLQTWIQAYYAAAFPWLSNSNLEHELSALMARANSEDGMAAFLQQLADHPPNGAADLPWIIFALTSGDITVRAKTSNGLPVVPPHQSWLAADRPFVNRKELRKHLEDLATSPPGARCILVIEGEARSGKSFAVSLARGCQAPENLSPTIDMKQYATHGTQVDSRELAVTIVGDESGCPSYDKTKDDEAVPRLLQWMSNRLKTRKLWVIIDHWNRGKSLTQGAISLLKEFAEVLRNGALPNVRLILVDFDRNDLPIAWRNNVRHDRAVLPDACMVHEWCVQLATAAKRKHSKQLAKKWAGDVFSNLDVLSRDDGTWHMELENRLRQTIDRIMECEVMQ